MMNKTLATVSPMPLANSSPMTGKNNFNINNQDGGTVNFNCNFYSKDSNDNATQMIAVQSFSKEYYQLIVTQDDRIFTSNSVTVNASNALLEQNVPSEIYKKCSSLSDEGKEFLKKLPTIICMKNTSKQRMSQLHLWAIYCYVDLIEKQGNDIRIDFKPLAAIEKKAICEERVATYFDLNMSCAITDFNIIAWSVRRVNLFDAFAFAGINNVPVPNYRR